jgi:hypothetical protein
MWTKLKFKQRLNAKSNILKHMKSWFHRKDAELRRTLNIPK